MSTHKFIPPRLHWSPIFTSRAHYRWECSNPYMSNLKSSLLVRATHFFRKSNLKPNPRFLILLTRRNPNSNSLKTVTTFSSKMAHSSVGFSSSAATGSVTSNGGDAKHRVDHFALSSSSALKIQKGDITQWSVDGASDAIVNAANERMLGGGGVDGGKITSGRNIPILATLISPFKMNPTTENWEYDVYIGGSNTLSAECRHQNSFRSLEAAGPELRAACYDVAEVRPGVRCPTGEARITPAFKLPVSHVIHTVGPVYEAHEHPEVFLTNSYRNSLRVAKENNIQYIAFPAISCGIYGYPYDEAATIAISTIKEFAADFKEVHFVLFSDDIYNVWLDKANGLL